MLTARGVTIVVTLAFTGAATLKAEPNSVFSELDATIARQLADEKWDDAGKAYVRAIWEDYRKAHLNGGNAVSGTRARMPDTADPNDYVGDYSKTLDGQPRLLRISRSDVGCFFVELEGHRIPAVLTNQTILFTTGDIVQSKIPALTDKPYGELELMALSRTGGKFYLSPPGEPPQTSVEVFKIWPEPVDTASKMKMWVEKAIGEAFDELKGAIKPVMTQFTQRELPGYPLFAVNKGLIAQINEDEMLAFLKSRGVQLTAKDIVTTDNLVAYLRHKKLGTEASYAWFDLTKGNPDFPRAALDWQTIRNERGFEFIPTYYLLYSAKLKDRRDAEVWADFFRAAFNSLTEQDLDKKTLVAMCVFSHLGEFKAIQPPPLGRFAFLAEEIAKQKDMSKPYSQILLLIRFSVDFASKDFMGAAKWSKDLRPPSAGLFLSFASYTFANDVDGAAATLASLEKVSPRDKDKLDLCRAAVQWLREKKQNEQETKTRQMP